LAAAILTVVFVPVGVAVLTIGSIWMLIQIISPTKIPVPRSESISETSRVECVDD